MNIYRCRCYLQIVNDTPVRVVVSTREGYRSKNPTPRGELTHEADLLARSDIAALTTFLKNIEAGEAMRLIEQHQCEGSEHA